MNLVCEHFTVTMTVAGTLVAASVTTDNPNCVSFTGSDGTTISGTLATGNLADSGG